MKPDGVLVSGGPGNPEDVAFIADELKKIAGKIPMFGVGLGHELIGMAYGAKVYKLKFGHHGGNHPVKTLANGNIETVSQNHNYAIDAESVKDTKLTITHVNILDGAVAGLACEEDKVFSLQYHPQISIGPNGRLGAYQQFIALMKEEI
jgi:carbamoyl-phosphate synthase small subunit